MVRVTGVVRILAIAGALACAGSIWQIHQRDQKSAYLSGNTVNVAAAQAYWERVIKSGGTSTARRQFLSQGAALSAGQAHILAHAFGSALYEAVGVDGITACGDEFMFGCYHQLIGNAIVSSGMSVLPRLYALCGGAFGCEHGIGHGLIGSLGYSLNDLTQALSVCKSLNPQNPHNGCEDGAYMEYNMHELAAVGDDGRFSPRELTSQNTLSPCDAIDPRFDPACVYELPNWWIIALGSSVSLDARFATMGSYCAKAALRGAAMRACYEGIGFQAPESDSFMVGPTLRYCDDVSTDPSIRLLCLSGAARRYAAAHVMADSYGCADFGLTGSSLSYCIDVVTTSLQSATALRTPDE